jgi:sulfide:quinone oxidoreductase
MTEGKGGAGAAGWDRRRVLGMGLGLGLAAGGVLGAARGSAQTVRTTARIVIAGAGAAGLTMASRLARGLDGAEIVLVDARADHYYQPGFTLVYDFLVVATGLQLDYAAIAGMDVARIGQNGLGSVYAGPEAAAATWRRCRPSPTRAAWRCSGAPRPR